MMMTTTRSELLRDCRRVVLKLGSALVTDEGRGINQAAIERWVAEAAALRAGGCEVLIVSSGAIAEGMVRLGWRTRPHALNQLQAAAAVGQTGLVQAYESACQQHGLHTAQILLTHEDLSDRRRYLNARSTLTTLLGAGVIPVINENDTVATDEIRFGDNDTLAALVANLVEAHILVILTDIDGLFTADPRRNPAARLVSDAVAGDPALDACAGDGGALGRGGMRTKVRAAALAARSGTVTLVANGTRTGVIGDAVRGEEVGTLFRPPAGRIAARKQWLAGGLKPAGEISVDAGAERVLREHGRSLLAVGVTGVGGDFQRGELVICRGADGRELGRGLINYSAAETRAIRGLPSRDIEAQLGYVYEPELIHRDNLVVF